MSKGLRGIVRAIWDEFYCKRGPSSQIFEFRYLCRKYIALNLIEGQRITRFLEVGFGEGDWTLTLARRGYKGTAIEVSQVLAGRLIAALKGAGLAGSVLVRTGDLFHLDEPEKYDAVFIFEVLEHLVDDIAALKKLKYLLAPTGFVVVSVPAHDKLWGPSDVVVGHVRRYTRSRLASVLAKAGFENTRIVCYGFPVGRTINVVRRVFFGWHRNEFQWLERKVRTGMSGYNILGERFAGFLRLLALVLVPLELALCERWFQTELGDGYIALAQG